MGQPSVARLRAALRSPTAAGVMATAAVLALVLGLRTLGALQPLELAAYDRLLAVRAAGRGPDLRVLQVSITEADLNRFAWPLPDGTLATIIDRLHEGGARAIGIDIFRPAPIEPGAAALARTVASTPELVWVDRFSQPQLPGIAAPAGMEASGRVGFADMVLDPGGVARRGLLYLNDTRGFEASLPLKLALAYLARDGIVPSADRSGFLRLGGVSLPPLGADAGGYAGFDARGYQILREFRSGAGVATITLGQLLDNDVTAAVSGKIVLVGIVADSVKDSVISPVGDQPAFGVAGVTVQALFASQLLQHALDGVVPTRPLPERGEMALIALCVVAAGLLGTALRNGSHLCFAILAGGASLLGLAIWAFLVALWLPVVPMAGGWMIAAAFAGSVVAFVEKQQHRLLMRLFSAAVSAPIARELWRRRHEYAADGRPLPVRLTATVMFADINDFTTISETLEPNALVRWLDLYMQELAGSIGQHLGIVAGFVGDGLMATFGVPIPRSSPLAIQADAVAAMTSALQIQAALPRLNERFAREGLPAVRAAIGIHSGMLVACSLGTTERQQYTVIGDTANTASRLVQVAKERMRGSTEACVVVTAEPTQTLVRDRFELRSIGSYSAKGKSQALQCYLAMPASPAPGGSCCAETPG